LRHGGEWIAVAGYGTSTEAMQKASKGISDAAKDTADELKKVGQTETVEADFGVAHTQHFAKYQTGIENFGKGITNMTSVLGGFAGKIGSGAGTYDDVESTNAGDLGSQY
jgi:phage-related protein